MERWPCDVHLGPLNHMSPSEQRGFPGHNQREMDHRSRAGGVCLCCFEEGASRSWKQTPPWKPLPGSHLRVHCFPWLIPLTPSRKGWAFCKEQKWSRNHWKSETGRETWIVTVQLEGQGPAIPKVGWKVCLDTGSILQCFCFLVRREMRQATFQDWVGSWKAKFSQGWCGLCVAERKT